jgi:ABC-type arginine transport system ATPase subunit
LQQFSDRHPLALSGGQQQRLVVATARLSGRRIVVFDIDADAAKIRCTSNPPYDRHWDLLEPPENSH